MKGLASARLWVVAKRYFMLHTRLHMDDDVTIQTGVQAAVRLAINLAGGPERVAEIRGLKSAWAVRKWIKDGLPLEHALPLAELTGWRVTPHQLAPEAYPNVEDGLPPLFRRAARRAASASSESAA